MDFHFDTQNVVLLVWVNNLKLIWSKIIENVIFIDLFFMNMNKPRRNKKM